MRTELLKALGNAFGIKNGVVDSGKPLTKRRIRAVCDAAATYAARAKLDKKFEDVSTLLNGGGIDAIIKTVKTRPTGRALIS